MSNKGALAVLEARLAELERKRNALIQVINDLRAEDGSRPRETSKLGSGGARVEQAVCDPTLDEIAPDVFEGKKLQTAVREYLTLRRLQRAGPATPREIYNGLAKGGFQFGGKSEVEAFAKLRSLLRKRATFFHKLPNGTYGMTAWYTRAKPQQDKMQDRGPVVTEAGKGAGKPEATVKEGKSGDAVQARDQGGPVDQERV